MRRRFLIWSSCALLGMMLGCSSSRPVIVADASRDPKSDLQRSKGQEIKGYYTVDGKFHEYKGRVRFLPPDSLEFWAPRFRESPWGSLPDRLRARLAMPRDSVQSVLALHTSAAKTVFATLGIVVLTCAVILAIVIATKESCPFLYSYDGSKFVFDGEPYGGATMKALERTDWSEMEHLAATRGKYRVLITNEVDETQHTNSLMLLAVDHAPGAEVILDKAGTPHAFRRLLPLTAARDERGADLLPWLSETDYGSWYPDLRAHSRQDSLEDTRNHITLEFQRPAGVSRAYLVTNVATGQWGSHMIRTMLRLRGGRVGEFYEAINTDPAARLRLHDWNEREELFSLVPEVECEGGWEKQEFIPGGGPFIGESRAIPLDLSRVAGPTLRVRIHPPIGFWSLNSFHVAWEEGECETRELLPVSAHSPSGTTAIVGSLRADDEAYLDFRETGDQAEVTFDAPPVRPGYERTMFARTRGWYEIHLHGLGDPDMAGIARLSYETGYAVRLALSEFAEFQRSGVLLGTR